MKCIERFLCSGPMICGQCPPCHVACSRVKCENLKEGLFEAGLEVRILSCFQGAELHPESAGQQEQPSGYALLVTRWSIDIMGLVYLFGRQCLLLPVLFNQN